MYLEKINGPADVKALNSPERTVLATEMRTALIQKLSHHGGHCGPNLGLVEATIALHTVFDSPKDRFVFDVSHQTYPHKMLTGRSYGFLDPARYDDITGYSAPQESAHDPFTLGHTSTSVSLACGLAKARDAKGEHHNVVAIIGDGSLSGGEALEGLDLAGEMDSNLIIVVNDNGMSIAENHGGIYRNLELLRQTGGKAACNLFRAMGLDYVFQPEGNHTDALIETFQRTYDQLSQDLCINNNPATLLVFAASVYGMNDVTHLGIFDIPMISNIPNLVYLAPTTKEEYFAMLHWSMTQREHPVAIRVPACGVLSDGKAVTKDFGKLNTYEVTQAGSDVAFIGLGSFYPLAQQTAAEYEKRTGVRPTVINPYYITGLDKELLAQLGKTHKTVVTLEDGVLDGGFGQKIAAYYGGTDTKVLCYGLQKEFLDRYDVQSVLEENRLTSAQISDDLQNL